MDVDFPSDSRRMQVGYVEGLLSFDGEVLIQRAMNCFQGTGPLRFAAYLHLFDPNQHLRWQYGEVTCPPVDDIPVRLSLLMPYKAYSQIERWRSAPRMRSTCRPVLQRVTFSRPGNQLNCSARVLILLLATVGPLRCSCRQHGYGYRRHIIRSAFLANPCCGGGTDKLIELPDGPK